MLSTNLLIERAVRGIAVSAAGMLLVSTTVVGQDHGSEPMAATPPG